MKEDCLVGPNARIYLLELARIGRSEQGVIRSNLKTIGQGFRNSTSGNAVLDTNLVNHK